VFENGFDSYWRSSNGRACGLFSLRLCSSPNVLPALCLLIVCGEQSDQIAVFKKAEYGLEQTQAIPESQADATISSDSGWFQVISTLKLSNSDYSSFKHPISLLRILKM